ncbi:MAG: hypothetical protein FJ123_00150 [Deltaproteobacteria bacterium]|nr:hypothetical protein [Deltaproteobacteria bacterium]
MRKGLAQYVEVCDIPYRSESVPFYEKRIGMGLQIMELRKSARSLFGKEDAQLTMRDLKLAFLKLCPMKVNLGGTDHEVTVKKVKGSWVLSCNCPSWTFNRNGKRRCKHTEHIENLMTGKEKG